MKKIVILGAAESGTGAALLGKAKGYDVFVSDSNRIREEFRKELQDAGVAYEEGGHTEEIVLSAGEIVKSPGIPDQVPILKKAAAKGIPVISELEFAFRHVNGKIIAITGSNGKTTTTLLVYHLLKEAGLNVGLAGNVGNSFARLAIDDPYDFYVIEVSSFQLDGMYDFKAGTAILLNITPDHLDRYDYNFQKYIDSKFRIARNMTHKDAFIYFAGDRTIVNELDKRQIAANCIPISLDESGETGAFYREGKLVFMGSAPWSYDVSQASLKGRHNYVNMMAAAEAALIAGAEPEAVKRGLSTFKNAAHRMEPAGEVNGVSFVNDSKATNVDAAYYALESFTGPVVWIAGGTDKGNDYQPLYPLMEKVRALVCLGKDNSKLKASFEGRVGKVVETQDIDSAVEMAYRLSRKGDVALLSPACASFDLFENYIDRGEKFKAAVRRLKERINE